MKAGHARTWTQCCDNFRLWENLTFQLDHVAHTTHTCQYIIIVNLLLTAMLHVPCNYFDLLVGAYTYVSNFTAHPDTDQPQVDEHRGQWQDRDPHKSNPAVDEPAFYSPVLYPQQASKVNHWHRAQWLASFLPWSLHKYSTGKLHVNYLKLLVMKYIFKTGFWRPAQSVLLTAGTA